MADLSDVSESTNSSSIQGPRAPDVFLEAVTSEVNKGDVYKMVQAQQHMLMRFEKTNEMLLNFNGLSKARFDTTQLEFRKHTQLLADMKVDLDNVFKRIRTLKTTLSKQYPEAFTACSDVYNLIEDDEEEEEDDEDAPSASGSQHPQGSDSPRLARQITVIAAPKKDQTKLSTGIENKPDNIDQAEDGSVLGDSDQADQKQTSQKSLGLKRH